MRTAALSLAAAAQLPGELDHPLGEGLALGFVAHERRGAQSRQRTVELLVGDDAVEQIAVVLAHAAPRCTLGPRAP